MPADPQQILADPNFHALPLGERLKVMRTVDPRFAALPAKEQGTVLYQSAVKANPRLQATGAEGPPDQGFLNTLLPDLFYLPLNAVKAAVNPIGFGRQLGQQAVETGKKAVQAGRQGDPLGALGYGTAAALPLIGPAAAQAGEEFQQGQYGQGTAHALELLAPFSGEALPPLGRAASQGIRAAATAFKETPASFPLTFIGEQLGQATGHPVLGTVLGAGLPKTAAAARAGVKGAIEGFKTPPRPTPMDIMPMPKLLGPGTPGTPDTSGPVPFTPPDYWNNPPRSPSGGLTMPPGPFTPPATVDLSKLEDIQYPPPPQSPVGPHVQKPHIPAHYAGEPNMEAAFKNDKAVVRELNKVNINSEDLTPDMVHVTRKAIGQRALKPADVDRRVGHVRWLLDHPEWQSPD